MISQLFVYESGLFDPYLNLATEKFLFDNLPDNSIIFYLWQNDNTVVIGKNQNPWKEIDCDAFLKSGGFVMRRNTGGGAVFHDKGNLNFTFIANKENYSLERNFNVVINALKEFQINAEISGRNDIITENKKFSGNAFLHSENKSLHHGTLLLTSTAEKISSYLTPNKEKLNAKGVKSVSSRIINLNEINPEINPQIMKKALIKAFQKEFGLIAESNINLEEKAIEKTAKEYSSWDYIFGKTLPFSTTLQKRLSFGNCEFNFNFKSGKFSDIKVYTDSLDTAIPDKFYNALKDCELNAEKIEKRLSEFFSKEETKEILEFFKNNLL